MDIHQKLIGALVGMPRVYKRLLALSVDTLLCFASVPLAFYLRLGYWDVPHGEQWLAVFAGIILSIPLMVSFGLYRAIFRYSDGAAIVNIVKVACIYGLIYSGIFTILGVVDIPRTVGIIQPILLFISILSTRGIVKLWLGESSKRIGRGQLHRRVIIYGAGSAGRQLAAALDKSHELDVKCYIDDDVSLHGGVLNGRRIFPSEELPRLIEKFGVHDLLLAMPSATRRKRNDIIALVRNLNVVVRTLPGVADIAHGKVQVSDLRELQIEDLLGRDSVAPNEILMARNIFGKTVAVTGAGGSIGSELCRQISRQRPGRLLLIEQSEFALYSIHQELSVWQAENGCDAEIIPVLASVTDETRMRLIMTTWRPQTIYHAAAYKHVPLVEHNVTQGIANNALGTWTTARAAIAAQVANFVLVSTDKAVRPTNVMGASKRLAELILQALNEEENTTRFSMVRFGNVLGSSGSVVPLFRNQIAQGGPVTVTHPDMTRYFMTIPEASQLVIQASAMASGGEVFVLDMGEPVRIVELARNMIELSGLTERTPDQPDGDIEIEYVGLRPGEKLYEELLIGDGAEPTTHPRIMKANEHFLSMSELQPILEKMAVAVAQQDVHDALGLLRSVVQEYGGPKRISDHFRVNSQ